MAACACNLFVDICGNDAMYWGMCEKCAVDKFNNMPKKCLMPLDIFKKDISDRDEMLCNEICDDRFGMCRDCSKKYYNYLSEDNFCLRRFNNNTLCLEVVDMVANKDNWNKFALCQNCMEDKNNAHTKYKRYSLLRDFASEPIHMVYEELSSRYKFNINFKASYCYTHENYELNTLWDVINNHHSGKDVLRQNVTKDFMTVITRNLSLTSDIYYSKHLDPLCLERPPHSITTEKEWKKTFEIFKYSRKNEDLCHRCMLAKLDELDVYDFLNESFIRITPMPPYDLIMGRLPFERKIPQLLTEDNNNELLQ